jgi:DNA-binding IclR family transcriptional regulator
MYLKLKEAAEVTMPLRDRNGEIIAALKVTMTCPKGESATVSAARALKAKKEVESRLDPLQDIRQ